MRPISEKSIEKYKKNKERYGKIKEKFIGEIVQSGDAKGLEKLVSILSASCVDIHIDDFEKFLNKCNDEMLMFILKETFTPRIAFYCVKFIDKFNLSRINRTIKEGNLIDEEKENVIRVAKKLSKALKSKPVFYSKDCFKFRVSSLNKFVIGLQTIEKKIHIAWVKAEYDKLHTDIFDTIGGGAYFPNYLRSGGYIELFRKSGTYVARFFGRSNFFGRYNHNLLMRFEKEIKQEISKQIGADCRIKIEVSR